MIRIFLLKGFFLLLVSLTELTKSFACTCIGKATIEQSYGSADIVYSGKVIAVYIDEDSTSYRFRRVLHLVTTFVIDEIYKGENQKSDTIQIITAYESASCGIHFEMGRSYIVYAKKNEFSSVKIEFPYLYSTDKCTRTRSLDKNRKERRRLRRLSRK